MSASRPPARHVVNFGDSDVKGHAQFSGLASGARFVGIAALTERRISSLVIKAYDAMGEPALWASFLTQYSELAKAGVCGFQVHYFSEHRSETLSFVGLPTELRRSYQAHYTKINPQSKAGDKLAKLGSWDWGAHD